MGVCLLLCLLALPGEVFATLPSASALPASLGPSGAPGVPQDLPEESPQTGFSSLSRRNPNEKWSWSKSLAPRLTDGNGLASITNKQLKIRRRAKRAGSIISATAVAFADQWRVGVSELWYASRGWGWRHPDNWKSRTYICVYGMDGRPCGSVDSGYKMWPPGIHCSSNQCCSKVHMSIFFHRNVCTSNSALCVFKHDEYSYGQCKCKSDTCPGDGVCVEELHDHGGVYCKCKEGMAGNGMECYEDKCSQMNCDPGKCVQDKTEARCECPKGYELADNTCEPIPMCNRGIENICGPPERVLECVNVGRTDWTCVCAAGYAVVHTTAGKQCELASNTLFCAGNACGKEGVEKCEDLAGGGVQCTCKTGFLLERTDDGKKFKCSPIDPCKTKPCGAETVAKKCSRTAGGSYHCECLATAELVPATDTDGPYCKHIEEEVNVLPHVLVAAGGLLLLGVGVGVWWLAFKSGSNAANDYDFTNDSFVSTAQ